MSNDVDELEPNFFQFSGAFNDPTRSCRIWFRRNFNTYLTTVDEIVEDMLENRIDPQTRMIFSLFKGKENFINHPQLREVVRQVQDCYGLNDLENPITKGDKQLSLKKGKEILEKVIEKTYIPK